MNRTEILTGIAFQVALKALWAGLGSWLILATLEGSNWLGQIGLALVALLIVLPNVLMIPIVIMAGIAAYEPPKPQPKPRYKNEADRLAQRAAYVARQKAKNDKYLQGTDWSMGSR